MMIESFFQLSFFDDSRPIIKNIIETCFENPCKKPSVVCFV